MHIFFPGNDLVLRFKDLRNVATGGGHENTATVQVTVRDSLGVNVPGAVNIVLTKIAGDTSGLYEGVLEDTVPIIAGQSYTALVTIDAGGGKKAQFIDPVIAVQRAS